MKEVRGRGEDEWTERCDIKCSHSMSHQKLMRVWLGLAIRYRMFGMLCKNIFSGEVYIADPTSMESLC